MEDKRNALAGPCDGLAVGDVARDLFDTHIRKFWVMIAGQAANGSAAFDQTFDERAAEKPAAAGHQYFRLGSCFSG
jgi:hypothetical protein